MTTVLFKEHLKLKEPVLYKIIISSSLMNVHFFLFSKLFSFTFTVHLVVASYSIAKRVLGMFNILYNILYSFLDNNCKCSSRPSINQPLNMFPIFYRQQSTHTFLFFGTVSSAEHKPLSFFRRFQYLKGKKVNQTKNISKTSTAPTTISTAPTTIPKLT